jgi:chromosome segregation and condensation protein ScpB
MARIGDTPRTSLKSVLEAVLLASGEPLSLSVMAAVFTNSVTTTQSVAWNSGKSPMVSASR